MENFHEESTKEETSNDNKVGEDKGKKKAGWLKKNVALAGAIGLGYFGGGPNTQAESTNKVEEAKQGERIEHVEGFQKITEGSKWASDTVNAARAELERLETAEDASWFMKDHFNKFVGEFYMPTKGNISEGPYGTKTRENNSDDNRNILNSAKEMSQILDNVNTKFPLPEYVKMKEQFQDIIKKSEKNSSYSGGKQRKILNEALEKFGK